MKENAKRFIFVLGWIIFFVLLGSLYVYPYFSQKKECNVHYMEEWKIAVDQKKEKDIVLPENIFEENTKNTEIYTMLTEDFQKEQTLCFWTYHQDVKVYVDNECIYTTESHDRFGKANISKWNIMHLPKYSEGKSLKISMSSPYDMSDFFLTEVIYGTKVDVFQWIYKNYVINQILDFVLIIASFSFILCIGIYEKNKYRWSQLFFGFFILFLGIWIRNSHKGLMVMRINSYEHVLIGYLAFFLAPIILTLYVRMGALGADKFVKISESLLLVECVNLFVIFIQQGLGIRDIQENILFGWIAMFVSVIWEIIVLLFWYAKKYERLSILMIINGFIVLGVLIITLIWENVYIADIRFDILIRFVIIIIAILEFVVCVLHSNRKRKIQIQMEEENRNLQLQVLTGQIRPHFILNTLGAIRSLIRQDPNRASDLLYDFSKYIRKNMEQKDYMKRISFFEELDYISTYLKLETIRFGERLTVKYDIKEDEFWVLPLTIQPFVENAVKHGIMKKTESGTIWISTYRDKNNIVIEVKDDGIGFDVRDFREKLKDRKSIGMRSAIMRLEELMMAKCEIQSSMKKGTSGTVIRITIPEKGAVMHENNHSR